MNTHTLVNFLKQKAPLAVAFSGGVDSSVLAKAAFLASKKSIAVTINDPSISRNELAYAKRIAREIGIRHIIVKRKLPANVARNDCSRCYYCKKNSLMLIRKIAQKNNISTIAYGANKDDLGDYRPGMAAAKELGAWAPLLELGIRKAEVRKLAKEMKLPNYSKPSSPCLSSRIPRGERITNTRLGKIEKAEKAILSTCNVGILRVRDHGDIARIEVEQKDMDKILKAGAKISSKLKQLGYKFVVLDIRGYKTGGWL